MYIRYFIVAGLSALGVFLVSSRPLDSKDTSAKGPFYLDEESFVFFAVLEGLFEDGASEEIVKQALEEGSHGYMNFVYACPICSPALEAFRAYSQRRSFYYSRKGELYDTSCSMPSELVKLLTDPSRDTRRKGLEQLVQRYAKRRIELLRLSEKEKRELHEELEKARKQGMDMLQRLPENQGKEMKTCSNCEGSLAGSSLK